MNANCSVCQKPTLPGYTTCGSSTCQEISTLMQRASNATPRQRAHFFALEIERLENERQTYDMITRKATDL